MNALSDELRRRIAALRPDWNPARVSGFLYLEGGYSNDNYRFTYDGERYVLRAPFRHRGDLDRHLEQQAYHTPAAPLTPELMAFDAASGDMISRWVPGTLLADRSVGAHELVDYLVYLHNHLPVVDRDYDPLAQARRHLEAADAPGWVERLADVLVWHPETAVTCHNDLNPWNVICTSDAGWVTLDWEWMGRNDPLFDLVTLYQGAALAADELPRMAQRYLGAKVSAPRLHRCLSVFWLRETTWAMAEIAAGNDRPEVVGQQSLGLARLEALGRESSPAG